MMARNAAVEGRTTGSEWQVLAMMTSHWRALSWAAVKSDCYSGRDILTDLGRIDNSKGDKNRIEETH